MATQPEQLSTEELQLYWQQLGKARSAEADNLEKLLDIRRECERVMQQLAELPQKLRHPIMVPVGKHAFFPGHLYHTNEVMVDIGAGFHVECTAAQAAAILERRCKFLDNTVHTLRKQLQVLDTKQAVAGSHAAEEPMEIRQSEEESDALLATARQRPPLPPPAAQQSTHRSTPGARHQLVVSDAALQDWQARLRELQQQEAAAEATEATGEAAASARTAAAASVPARSSLLQAMERLEMESDSDDELDGGPAAPELAPAGGLPLAFQPVDLDDLLGEEEGAVPSLGSAATKQHQHSHHRQQQQQQQHQGAATISQRVQAGATQARPGGSPSGAAAASSLPAAARAAAAAKPQPKSILKKGFLLSSSTSRSSASASAAASSASSSSAAGKAGAPNGSSSGGGGGSGGVAAGGRGLVPQALANESEVAKRREEAFTGQVMEKPGDAPASTATLAAAAAAGAGAQGHAQGAPSVAVGAPMPKAAAVAAAAPEPPAAPVKKLSKFKQKAMGLL